MDCLREINKEELEDEEDAEESMEWMEDEIAEYYLPVCNSTRMGVCGYEGSEVYPDQFVPDKKKD
ncbi:MAG: hypothetical protein HFH01_01395 [Dorea sp.]|nr:hypothetical protein [Dorea sp.]